MIYISRDPENWGYEATQSDAIQLAERFASFCEDRGFSTVLVDGPAPASEAAKDTLYNAFMGVVQ